MSRRTPEGRKGVETYSEAELRQFLVADAVAHHATYLPWAVAAYERIGKLSGRGAEAAYQETLDEVESLTGVRALPVTPSATGVEIGRWI